MPQPSPSQKSIQHELNAEQAQNAAQEHFGIQAQATPLDGYQDQNFKLQLPSGECFTLKYYHPYQSAEGLQQQIQVLAALGRSGLALPCPRDLPNLKGELLTQLEGGVQLRLLSWVQGVPLADVRPHSPGLLRDLGTQVAHLAGALALIEGPSRMPSEGLLPWDLLQTAECVRARLDAISSPERRALVEHWLPRIEPALALAARLPEQWLHNDANEHNILVDVAQPGRARRRVAGLIDFGDLTRGPRVIDPAICAAYACFHKEDPLGAMLQVAEGYQAVLALTEEELELLPFLAVARICLSVCMSAEQQLAHPENEYLAVSEIPGWRALLLLKPHSNELLRASTRSACGLAPSPACEALAARLVRLRPKRVMPDACYANIIELDLSIGSLDIPRISGITSADWEAQIESHMAQLGASMAVGRYNEARFCYIGPSYAVPAEDRERRRSVHLGIDLFAAAGTPLSAPLDAKVHSLHENEGQLNYGPTVILEHEIEGQTCFSLYGHLARTVLGRLKAGQQLAAGEPFAELGSPQENGGWPPHVHIQWIADLLGAQDDFPGVATPGSRELWLALSPDPRGLASLPPSEPDACEDSESLLQARAEHHAGTLSLSYQSPLHIVRGEGTQLFDAQGRAYLDAVNNVPHVGHGHPRVVHAAARQMALLNTNTRYLDRGRQRYMERLTALFPDSLSVCFLVCSGSEANELALRLARAQSGKRGVAVLDAAYHGNSSSLIELSPYKFNGVAGAGRAAHVQVLPAPDDYRGPWKRDDPERGKRYADSMLPALQAARDAGHPIGAFFAESLLGCAGQIQLPPGFLAQAYAHVRSAGGLCIADEVQVGFGRVGSHFWGFESQGVVPDIVTLGKPMGNGHPLAGVITTPEIAACFDDGMEYFNTFGGNPVSAAVGLAVLDVIEDEGLQANAQRVGAFLRAGFEALAQKHAIIGDVRGTGLFLGLELVHDRESLEPAAEVASYVTERLREKGILINSDGPLHNVLKIKPPLVFSQADAQLLLAGLAAVLSEDPAQVHA